MEGLNFWMVGLVGEAPRARAVREGVEVEVDLEEEEEKGEERELMKGLGFL